jgi:hypothetical protein
MVHPFVSLPARVSAVRRFSGVSFSAAVHSALIAASVVATMPPPVEFFTSVGDVAQPRVEHVDFVRTIPADETRAADKADPKESDEGSAVKEPVLAFVVEDPSVATITGAEIAPVVTPDLDLESETQTWVTKQFDATNGNSKLAESLRKLYAAPVDGAYDREVVEKTVWPRPNNPRPSYPTSLLSAGVEAHVLARFVVDSTGRVNERSLVFPAGVHRLFVDAVKRSLLRSRFFPAELAGRRVSQHVIQEFIFRIER